MDEKTAELREIFVDVVGEEEPTVTESQEAGRGSLRRAEAAVEEALLETVGRMRERFGFSTDLDDETYCRVVRGFFDGEADAAVAEAIDASPGTVVRARIDLHLVREQDLDAPVDREALRALPEATAGEAAAELGVSAATLGRYREALAARDRSRRAGGRYRREFAERLTDADLETGLDDRTYDGLREAAADVEHDLAF
jgi:hypothetical protein